MYKSVVCPLLEYAHPVWYPHTTQNINALESVQCRQQVKCYISLVGANHLMTASRSYIGLPFTNTTIITLFMIVYTTEILYLFMNITNYLELHPDLISYLFIKSHPPLIHIIFPSLWTSHSFGTLTIWVIPCQVNQKFRITSRILMKLGIFVIPMGLITCTNF